MTSRQPYCCSKTKKGRYTKPFLRELNSIFIKKSSFFSKPIWLLVTPKTVEGDRGGLNLPPPVPYTPASRPFPSPFSPLCLITIPKYNGILRNFTRFLPVAATHFTNKKIKQFFALNQFPLCAYAECCHHSTLNITRSQQKTELNITILKKLFLKY